MCRKIKHYEKILIMGLPGSGKTTLANEIAPLINAKGLMQMKLEKKLMIGIFQKKEEKDKQKEWQILQKN